MADAIEIKKLKVELAGVSYAKMQFELKIEERLQEIENIKKQIALQEAREAELQAKLSDLGK